MKRLLVTTMLLVAALVGYLVADVHDVVPGVLTQRPVSQSGTTPTAPGATTPAAPGPAPTSARSGQSSPTTAWDTVRVRKAVTPILAEPSMGTDPSLVIYDGATGQELLDIRGNGRHIPASTAKVLTAAAALDRFGPAAQLPTTATLSGTRTITLVGGGDIFLTGGPGKPDAVNGRAGLADLATAVAGRLRARELTTVQLRLDDTVIAGIWNHQPLNPGWDPADVGNGFVAPATAIALNAGRITPDEYAKRQPDPAMVAADTFAKRLTERGITLTGPTTRARSPAGAATMGTIWSAPLEDVVQLVLQTSDNNGADVLAKLVALARGIAPTGPGGGIAVLAQVGDLGVPIGGLKLADGSGLAAGSVLSADALANALLAAADGEHPRLTPLLLSMPVAGLNGTLADRFSQPGMLAARGVVRAKTGTLTGASTLAGTVRDRSGRLLVFAVMAGPTPAATAARQDIDRIVTVLARCGCG